MKVLSRILRGNKLYSLFSVLLVFTLLITSLPPIISEASAQADESGNTALIANDDTYEMDDSGIVEVAAPGILGNDSNAGGDPLTIILIAEPANGTLTLNQDGSFTYIHDGSETTSDSFTYRVNDGTLDSNIATVVLTIGKENSPPVANGETYEVDSLGIVVKAAPGLLQNDTDPDGDTLSAILENEPAHGTLGLNPDGSFVYVHDGSRIAADSFTYKANDGTSDSDIVTVTIIVGTDNDLPVTRDTTPAIDSKGTGIAISPGLVEKKTSPITTKTDTYTVDNSGTLEVAIPGVLGNDTSRDGLALKAILVSKPLKGTLTLNPDGSFVYVHDGSRATSDFFAYKANDGTSDSIITIVNIAINPSPSMDKGQVEPVKPETKPVPTPEPVKVSGLTGPDQDFEIRSQSEKIELRIPSGAVSEEAKIEISDYGPSVSGNSGLFHVFELNAYSQASITDIGEVPGKSVEPRKIERFEKELTISIRYQPEDLKGIYDDSLKLYYLDEKTEQRVLIPSRYDRKTMTLTATLDHFSTYFSQADPMILGPGQVMAAQVGLQSGAAMYSYPIEVPPGSGGFQPNITLTYNGASVDEMKNSNCVSSWVGIGWTLNLGRITYNEADDEYFLELNGASYKLAMDSTGTYHTIPETFYKINKTGGGHYIQFTMYDREGTKYIFGGDLASRQYYTDTYTGYRKYYRYDLSSIQDINSGNSITINNQQNLWTDDHNDQHVRSAYPTLVTYNGGQVDIIFNTEDDRTDLPQDPSPVIENRRLDSIEIKVDDVLIRKYDLNNGGNSLRLWAITQEDGDSNSLPATTFGYDNLDTCNGVFTVGGSCLTWPRLSSIQNGYGGQVSFGYDQLGSEVPPYNYAWSFVWTRQVVDTKTINPGQPGTSQTITYSYGQDGYGPPQYITGIENDKYDDQFRGFSPVTETDAQGNYSIHYFYTTGTQDDDYRTGKEYKTEQYNSSGTLLHETDYTWDFLYTSDAYAKLRQRDFLSDGADIASAPDGSVVIAGGDQTQFFKLDEFYNEQFVGSIWPSDIQGIAVDQSGYIYVSNGINSIYKYTSSGGFIGAIVTGLQNPSDIAVDSQGNIYVIVLHQEGYSNYYVVDKYNSSGTYTGRVYGDRKRARGVAVDSNDNLLITHTDLLVIPGGWSWTNIRKYNSSGSCIYDKPLEVLNGAPRDLAIDSHGNIFVTNASTNEVFMYDSSVNHIQTIDTNNGNPTGVAVDTQGKLHVSVPSGPIMYDRPYTLQLTSVEQTTYPNSANPKTTRTSYIYDDYGNVVTETLEGDTSYYDDNRAIIRYFVPNPTLNILSKPMYEVVVNNSWQWKSVALYFYDENPVQGAPPTVGNLTLVANYIEGSDETRLETVFAYDNHGNMETTQDPEDNITDIDYDSNGVFPVSVTYPQVGADPEMQETYDYDPRTGNLNWVTDVNNQTTNYNYDSFGRLESVVRPLDGGVPSIEYDHHYGTGIGVTEQYLETKTRVDTGEHLWSRSYFDGIGRVVQTHANAESGTTIIASTTEYDNRGLVNKQYVPWEATGEPTSYITPTDQKFSTGSYDALGRVTSQTAPDGTTVYRNYSTTWQELVTNQKGNQHLYEYDAFGQLVKVTEINPSGSDYVTNYAYDAVGNLIEVTDAKDNITSMQYDLVSRKTWMDDPDMGEWYYGYDDNSNLAYQIDAKLNAINFYYDDLNRLKGKTYNYGPIADPETYERPSDPGYGNYDVEYTYDDDTSGNFGKGRRTGTVGYNGDVNNYRYDERGRLITETRNIDYTDYITQFTYDDGDRLTTVTYPTGEEVTQTYNDRGLPQTLTNDSAYQYGQITQYNEFGQIKQIDLGNGAQTFFNYWGEPGVGNGTESFGKLWQIETKDILGVTIQDVQHGWDENGNLYGRFNAVNGEVEGFTYDFLDRIETATLTGATPYTKTWAYDETGNITEMNGETYQYLYNPADLHEKPHAVTAVGGTSYTYDANGNMTTRGSQTMYWTEENKIGSISNGSDFSMFGYDADGNRLARVEMYGGVIEYMIYVNQYFEINYFTSEVTTHYYLGGRQVAYKKGSELTYVHQDHLTGTSLTTDSSGNLDTTISYFPFGETRGADTLDLDKKFTGQRLDDSGLYYYNARYYDATIGRFISPDTIVPSPFNPQSLNRYSYCLNNPLKYVDPSGHFPSQEEIEQWIIDNPDDGSLNDEGRQFAEDNKDRRTSPPDPAGNVVGVGMTASGALIGFGITGTVMYVEDADGNRAFIGGFGGGGQSSVVNVTAGLQYQFTNAKTIDDLEGWSEEFGISGGEGLGAGAEMVVGKDDAYEALNVQPVAFTAGIPPVEAHAYLVYNWVWEPPDEFWAMVDAAGQGATYVIDASKYVNPMYGMSRGVDAVNDLTRRFNGGYSGPNINQIFGR